MHYPDGQEIRLGDLFLYERKDLGIVLCDLDGDEYSANHTKEEWGEVLGSGVFTFIASMGLVHFSNEEDDDGIAYDTEFIERNTSRRDFISPGYREMIP